MECPLIVRNSVPNPRFNQVVDYAEYGGEHYEFYDHDDGYGKITRVQFCQLIGRKKNVFECLNESEWHACSHYRHSSKEA